MPGSFFDTNVLLYLASGDAVKADRAEQLVAGGGKTNRKAVAPFCDLHDSLR